MSPGERVRRQGGFTLLETLLTVAIAAMVLLPLFGWAFVASRQSTDAAVRNVDGASVGLLRSYFLRDVASADFAAAGTAANGSDCPGDPGEAALPEDSVLRLELDGTDVVYTRAPSRAGDGTSVWRRECEAGALRGVTELVRDIDAASLAVGCGPRPTMPSSDCGRISLSVQTTGGNLLSMSASLRAGSAAGGSDGGGGPVYVSPDVVVSVSAVEVYRGEVVTFDGSGSVDPRGGPLTYHWELGDGTTSTEAVTDHAYTQLGEFTAVFTATTSEGTPTSDYVRVRVVNRPPVAVISSPADGHTTYQCTNVSFAANGSNDAGDAAYGGQVARYRWSYGDGSTHVTTAAAGAHSRQYTRPSPDDGNAPFVVGLTVDDNDDGASTQVTRSVYVKNRVPHEPTITAQVQNGPLILGGSSYTGTKPLTVTFDATASDPDGSCDTLFYEWDLGGGLTDTRKTFTHTFTSGSSRTIRLTVSDEHGATRQSAPITLTLNTSPVAAFTLSPTTVRTGTAVTVTNQSTDAETAANQLTYSWTFEHGNQDGTNRTSSAQHPGTVTFSHDGAASDTFAPGPSGATYTVTLTVTDPQGGSSTTTRTVQVTGAPAPTGLSHSGLGCQGFLCTGSRYIDMSWNAVSSATRYQIRLECDWLLCGTNHTLETTATSYHQSGLPFNSGSYRFRVRARDAHSGRWGEWSEWRYT